MINPIDELTEQIRQSDIPTVDYDEVIASAESQISRMIIGNPLTDLPAITCPDCGAQTARVTVQGNAIELGAVIGCQCGAIFRVSAGAFGEGIDPKTCSVADLKLLDKVRQEVKRSRRQWAQFQRNNREQARAAGELPAFTVMPK